MIGFLTTVDHKRIGVRYVVTAFVFFFMAGSEALIMRSQLATANETLLSASAYNDLFTMHGTTMIFLFNTPVLAGFGNYLLPLQLGARDMAFPRLNAFGYWCFVLRPASSCTAAYFIGTRAQRRLVRLRPAQRTTYSTGLGLDFWALGVMFVGISSTTGAINFIVTIFKYRAPGMTSTACPLFVWSLLSMAFMILFAFPSLTLATVLLEVDRRAGTAFYDPPAAAAPCCTSTSSGSGAIPRCTSCSCPAIGMMSMIIPVFSRRRLSGYIWVVSALVAIAFISFGVWVHHMFATGLPALALSFFSAVSLIIAIPQRRPVLLRGSPRCGDRRVRWTTPMLFSIGFMAHLPDRRPVRRDGGGAAVRPPGHRQLLHRRPLPLRAQRRRRVPDLRRASTTGSRRSPAG